MNENNEALLREANDPETDPQRLDGLKDDPNLAPLVAANPNTPVKTLLSLIRNHPCEFLTNPILPLLYLEDPTLFQNLPYQDALRLLSCEHALEWLLTCCSQHRHAGVRDAVQYHIVRTRDLAGEEQSVDDA
ncbi:MAG TPA: hypothetical protein VKB76_15385, partial [Ktedonobacterales bacterium]|nr:hypothetical protein [Ktedonobacterales bacterium]